MNRYLQRLQPYPFEKLAQLLGGTGSQSEQTHISLSIGEPKHQPPAFILQSLNDNLARVSNYPSTKGTDELRCAISQWASLRFDLVDGSLTPDAHILPVNGTREALFAFVQTIFDQSNSRKKIVMPNPFYQIYEGAALLAGAEPHFLNCDQKNKFVPNFDAVDPAVWQQCQLLFVCSPGNPSGAVMNSQQYKALISLADKYNFIIASDECYSELYFDEKKPPAGLLQACRELERNQYERCVVFHSLSKRSNLPGMRSGFVAGDERIIKQFLLYRTYHGCAMPVHNQLASTQAWRDEIHVRENRTLYREKFIAVTEILQGALPVSIPEASFYLWPETPISDTEFTRQLFLQENVTVLPGSFLARDTAQGNPGKNRIRMALVASLDECIEAATRIKRFVEIG
ncbi:MAG: N-succinyldiaminopimelate aminotransferase [Lentisphaeria bacterium]|jgi:N-succinyldiaminopimelate aminotransferase